MKTKVILYTMCGPVNAYLTGEYKDHRLIEYKPYKVLITEDQIPFKKGEEFYYPGVDIYDKVKYSGINTISYSGNKWLDKFN
jgi:hypothetical protein